MCFDGGHPKRFITIFNIHDYTRITGMQSNEIYSHIIIEQLSSFMVPCPIENHSTLHISLRGRFKNNNYEDNK